MCFCEQCRSCDVWGVSSAAVDVVGVSAGVVRVEDVSGEMLGFLPRRRLLPEAVWRPAGLDHTRTCVTSRNGANSVETLSVWTFALDSNVCFTVFRSKKAQHVAFFDPKTIAQRFSVFFEKLWGFRTTSPPVYAQESYFSVWRAWCQKRVGRSPSDPLSCLPRRDDKMPNKTFVKCLTSITSELCKTCVSSWCGSKVGVWRFAGCCCHVPVSWFRWKCSCLAVCMS